MVRNRGLTQQMSADLLRASAVASLAYIPKYAAGAPKIRLSKPPTQWHLPILKQRLESHGSSLSGQNTPASHENS